MIPHVKSWIVTDRETGERREIDTINKRMVTIIMRLDYPRTWGHNLKIALKRKP